MQVSLSNAQVLGYDVTGAVVVVEQIEPGKELSSGSEKSIRTIEMTIAALFQRSPQGVEYLSDQSISLPVRNYLQLVAWNVTSDFYGWPSDTQNTALFSSETA